MLSQTRGHYQSRNTNARRQLSIIKNQWTIFNGLTVAGLNNINKPYHDFLEDESFPFPRWSQGGVLLRTGNLDSPDLLPGIVENQLGWVDS